MERAVVVCGRLAHRVALVTGAASGIGRAVALRFAAEGAQVVAVDVNTAGGQDTVDLITSRGGSGLFVRADVSRRQQIAAALDTTVAGLGQLDILVNNAAVELEATIEDTRAGQWWEVIKNNLYSVFLCSKLAIPLLRKHSGGAITNIGSVNGLIGVPRHAAYSAAKGGVAALTRQLAIDYGPVGIRVNCVCPGTTDTPMIRQTIGPDDFEERVSRIARRHPLKRIGVPEDIANAVLFLSSDEASWITGLVMPVDGGLSCSHDE